MQQVTNYLREDLELSYSSCSFKNERGFFFPRLLIISSFVLTLSYSLRISHQGLIRETW